MTVAGFQFYVQMRPSLPSFRQDGSGSVHPPSRACRIQDSGALRSYRPDQVEPCRQGGQSGKCCRDFDEREGVTPWFILTPTIFFFISATPVTVLIYIPMSTGI